MSEKTPASSNRFLRASLERPILTGLVLLAIAFVFKWVDTFVLRLDERLGEIILCKTLGFVLVIAFVWACGRKLQDIGLHGRRLGPSLLVGIGVAVIALVASYAVEFVVQLPKHPVIHENLRLETPPLAAGRKAGPPKAGTAVRCFARPATCDPRSGPRERAML